MLVYDVNLKEVRKGDTIQCGHQTHVIHQKDRQIYILMGKTKFDIRELSHQEIARNVIVLVDFEKVK
jgi:hypothetical protein